MDINNPGEEILKKANQMQQNADLQQAKQEEVQGFQRQTFFAEHPALSDAELEQFTKEQTAMVHDFLAVYKERATKAMPNTPLEEPVIATKEQVVPPVQEEPDEKTLKKNRKQKEKKIKEGKKKGILAASEYSVDMQKNYSAYMKRKATDEFNAGKTPELWKQYISQFKVDSIIGDPAYVGENLQEAQEYMDDLKEAIDYFTLHPEILSTMSLTFQQKVGSAMQSYPLMEAAYENALMKNGLKRSGNSLIPIDETDLVKLRSDEMVRQEILEQAEKNKTELDAIVAEEVEMHSKRLLAQNQELNQSTREEYKAKENTSFIETERISNPFHFEALDTFATMLEKHPEKYAANKEVLDSMMVYVRNVMEAVPLYTSDGRFDENMPEGIEPEVEAAIYARQDESDFKKDDLQETIIMTEMALKHILEDKPIYDKMAEFLYQFGYASPEYLAEQKKAVDAAEMYKNTFEFKTAIWMSLLNGESAEVQEKLKDDTRAFMLMQMEDTEEAHRYNQEVLEAKKQTIIIDRCKKEEQEYKRQHPELQDREQLEADEVLKALQEEKAAAQSEVVRLYKPKFQALYDKVMNMDIESLQSMDPKEIMNRQEDFLRVGMENMHLSDCCKTIEPVTKKSIRALVFPTKELEAIYEKKIALIQNYMVMGRMLGMMEAYKKDALTKDVLASETEEKKIGVFGVTGDVSDKILEFAKTSYAAAKRTAGNYQDLLAAAYEQKKVVDAAEMYKNAFEFKSSIWSSLLANESAEIQEGLKDDTRAFMLMKTEDTAEARRYNQEILQAKKSELIVNKCKKEEQEYKKQHLELQKEENATQLEQDAVLKALQQEKDAAQSEMVNLYKPKFQALYDKVMNTEIESLQSMDPQELMKRQKDFLSMGMENMHLSDCCKTIDPVTKKSVRELVFPTKELEAIYEKKIILIQNYMVMGRMVSIMEADKKETLTKDVLASEAEEKKTGVFGVTGDVRDKILEFAKKSYDAAKKTAGNYQKFLNEAYKEHLNKHYAEKKAEPVEKFAPDKVGDKISAVELNNKDYIVDNTEEVNREVYYNLVQAGKQEEADLLEAGFALQRNNYRLAGGTKAINEPIFRSFLWAEHTKGLKDMPESEFLSIVKLLSAGHLTMSWEQMAEKKIIDPMARENAETQEELQAKNKEGLRRLLYAEAPHLDYLEKKYGYEVPTYEYVVSHIDEIHDDFLFGQVSENIVTNFDVLDSNNPEEARMIHQIHFYNEVGIKAVSLFSQGGLGEEAGGTKLELINLCRDTSIIADSLNYLKTHPKTAGIGE